MPHDGADSTSEGSAGTRLIRPLLDFLHTEAAGGVALVVAAAVALIWANSPWSASYEALWTTELGITIGRFGIELDLRHWINDGLMAVFFFVIGLEIKRELVEGELREPRRAALPALAAVGGMVVPALLYMALNAGGEGADGWGIPMATDIAMAVGVLSLLGSRVPSSLKLFLLALAIVDDIGAILVIAVFYTTQIHFDALLISVGLGIAVLAMRFAGIRPILAYTGVGVAMWLALHESGLHATLVGVVLGLMTPTKPFRHARLVDESQLVDISTPDAAHETATLARESVSVVEWLEHRLHPWTSFLIVPLFALANAGVPLSASALSAAVSSPITHGVLAGLVVGKLVGVASFTWLTVRLGIGVLPDGATWPALVGIAALAGIGFTVSIFIADLAFDDAALQDEAKVGILAGSLAAAVIGSLILLRRPAASAG